jgi:hypothetical protein
MIPLLSPVKAGLRPELSFPPPKASSTINAHTVNLFLSIGLEFSFLPDIKSLEL